MYTKKVKYEDYFGEMHEETVAFNLTKIEMLKFQSSVEGGLDKYIEKIQKENDPVKMVLFFDMFVKAAYGKISDDGTRFIKNKELTEEFSQSAAYDTLVCCRLVTINIADINSIILAKTIKYLFLNILLILYLLAI